MRSYGMYNVDLICAARPNFMKIAPLYHALRNSGDFKPRLIHTGQHYDPLMSDVFFSDLSLPAPDEHLNVGSGSHAEQTAGVMVAYEKLARQSSPDAVIVVGDVNSSMAVAIAAKKLNLFVAHLEAGLRSGDRTMPEEINRILIDSISDLLWTPSQDASDQLRVEGVAAHKIDMTGNIMIDSYHLVKDKIAASAAHKKFAVAAGDYLVATLHRPANVDSAETLVPILMALAETGRPVIFPVHPRTRQTIGKLGIDIGGDLIQFCDPLGYVDFMGLVSASAGIVTDSGGIQEETTYLGIPCYTLRTTTERPITVSMGTNQLVTSATLADALGKPPKKGNIPPLWDGKTAPRVVESLRRALEGKA